MEGQITKIEKLAKSHNKGQSFIRVHFRLANGQWAKTDLVPGFRNFKRWKPLLKERNTLYALRLKDKETVDADCFPKIRYYPYLSLADEQLRIFAEAYRL